tara:strand:- start:482 stop:2950 length:2469 start_codon:yes stop_codon:yes gene_type:complete
MYFMVVLFRPVLILTVFSAVLIACNNSGPVTDLVTPTTAIITPAAVGSQSASPTSDPEAIKKGQARNVKVTPPTIIPAVAKNVKTNLTPFALNGRGSAISISEFQDKSVSRQIDYGDQMYITWAILNNGYEDIVDMFFVDVYLGNILVERWQIDELAANQYVSVQNWDGIRNRVRMIDGIHNLSLVIDPTGLLNEVNESDNRVDIQFELNNAGNNLNPQEEDPTLVLPDIVPWVLPDWESTLITTSDPGSVLSSKLSRDVQTHIRFGFSNQSLVSIQDDMWVYIYLDDILINAQSGKGLLAEESIGSKEWSGINTVIPIHPGKHKLRIELDATNLIIESDETNNVIEKELIWSEGPLELDGYDIEKIYDTQSTPSPLTLPNLVPGWRDGWDGPIIISDSQGTFTDSSLSLGEVPFIDLVVHNRSIVRSEYPLIVDLYIDDLLLERFNLGEIMEPNELRWVSDWDKVNNSVDLDAGVHALKMIIDPDNLVMESDENDNIYEKHFTWIVGKSDQIEIINYTEQELSGKLDKLEKLLTTRSVAINSDGIDFRNEILDVVDAGYYLVTGGSFLDERVDILILTRQDFLAWVDDYYSEQFALNDVSKYQSILDERQRVKERGSGLKTNRFGKDVIVVNGEYMIADVIGTVAHELGHLRQGILNPIYSDGRSSYYWKALKEAQAQQFERTFWLYIEDFIGANLMEYPDYYGFRTLIQKNLISFLDNMSDDEHLLGLLIQWLVVLEDQEMSNLRSEFNERTQLSSVSSRLLYEHLVSITEDESEDYVRDKLKILYSQITTIEELILSRLIKDGFTEGSPDLRFPGLFMP